MRSALLLLIPTLLLSCTRTELNQMFPPDQGGPSSNAGQITVSAENPGAGGTKCDVLNVTVAIDQVQVTQSPDLPAGGQWSRVLSATDLTGKQNVQLRAVCSITSADASGNTVTSTGYSVTDHVVTNAAQSLTVTGPRTKQNLAGRVEWATPVPGVLPLDQ